MTESPPADTSALVEPAVHEIPEPEAEILPLTSESINDSESEAQTVSSIEDHPDRTDEGIKVHGHWTIDVEEAGGRLISHNEFENALVSVGADLLSQILGHQKGVGAWQVQINGPINTGICDNLSGQHRSCSIIEQTAPSSYPNIIPGLTVDAPTTGTNSGKLVLAGTVTAANAGSVTSVYTALDSCDPTSTPADFMTCATGFAAFTHKTLSSPVTVLQGQTVNITVVISFS